MIKKCRSCSLSDVQQSACRMLQRTINLDKDYCPSYTPQTYICETCRAIIINPIFTIGRDNQWHTHCENCAARLNTCDFCANIHTCAFETDPSPIPKVVQKQERNGPMTSIRTIKNPDRIDITCRKGCLCFHSDFGCLRQFHGCDHIIHIYDEVPNDEA